MRPPLCEMFRDAKGTERSLLSWTLIDVLYADKASVCARNRKMMNVIYGKDWLGML